METRNLLRPRLTLALLLAAICGMLLPRGRADVPACPTLSVHADKVTVTPRESFSATVQWADKNTPVTVQVLDMWGRPLWTKEIKDPVVYGKYQLTLRGLTPWNTYRVVARQGAESAEDYVDVADSFSRSMRITDTEFYYDVRDDVTRFTDKLRYAHFNVVRTWGWNERLNGGMPSQIIHGASNETGMPPDVNQGVLQALIERSHSVGLKVQGYTARFLDADVLAAHPELISMRTKPIYGYNFAPDPAYQDQWQKFLREDQDKLHFDGYWVDYCPGEEPGFFHKLDDHPMVQLRHALRPGSLVDGNQGPWPDGRIVGKFPAGSVDAFCWEQVRPPNVQPNDRTYLHLPQAAAETRRLTQDENTPVWFQEGSLPNPGNWKLVLAMAKASRGMLSTESRSATTYVDLAGFRRFEAMYAGLFDAPAHDLAVTGVSLKAANETNPKLFISMYQTRPDQLRVVHLVNLTGVPTQRVAPVDTPRSLDGCQVTIPVEERPSEVWVLSPDSPAEKVNFTYAAEGKSLVVPVKTLSVWSVIVCVPKTLALPGVTIDDSANAPAAVGQGAPPAPTDAVITVRNPGVSVRNGEVVTVPLAASDAKSFAAASGELEDADTQETFLYQVDPYSASGGASGELVFVADFAPGQQRRLRVGGAAHGEKPRLAVTQNAPGDGPTYEVANRYFTLDYYAPWGVWGVRSKRAAFSFTNLQSDGGWLQTGVELGNGTQTTAWFGFLPRNWRVVSKGPVRTVLEEEGTFIPMAYWTRRIFIVYANRSTVTEIFQFKPTNGVEPKTGTSLSFMFDRGNPSALSPDSWEGIQTRHDARSSLPNTAKPAEANDWFAMWRKNRGGGFGMLFPAALNPGAPEVKIDQKLLSFTQVSNLPEDKNGWRTVPLEWVFFDLHGDSALVEEMALQDRCPVSVRFHDKEIPVSRDWVWPFEHQLMSKYRRLIGSGELSDQERRDIEMFTK